MFAPFEILIILFNLLLAIIILTGSILGILTFFKVRRLEGFLNEKEIYLKSSE